MTVLTYTVVNKAEIDTGSDPTRHDISFLAGELGLADGSMVGR